MTRRQVGKSFCVLSACRLVPQNLVGASWRQTEGPHPAPPSPTSSSPATPACRCSWRPRPRQGHAEPCITTRRPAAAKRIGHPRALHDPVAGGGARAPSGISGFIDMIDGFDKIDHVGVCHPRRFPSTKNKGHAARRLPRRVSRAFLITYYFLPTPYSLLQFHRDAHLLLPDLHGAGAHPQRPGLVGRVACRG